MLIRLRAARLALLATSTAALLVLAPTGARADSGGIDATYGTSGSTSLSADTTFNDALRMADGSTVAVGTSGTSTTVAIVAKFTAGGALDTSFGAGGVVTIDVPGGTKDAAFGVSQRSGGGFVVAGTNDTTFAGAGAITKLTAAGVPDVSWGVAGTATIGPGTMAIAYDAYEDAPGTAVFAARDSQDLEGYVGRVDGGGDITAGGVNWFSHLDLLAPDYAATNTQIGGLVELSPGTYAVAASAQRADGSSEIGIIHFPAAGDGVASYDSSTVGSRVISTLPLIATGIRSTPGGTAMATVSSTVAGSTTVGGLVRITAAGVIDTAFGTSGLLALPAASESWAATDIAPTADGKWFVTGNVGASRVRTQRLTSTFAPDTTFGDANGAADRSYSSSGTRASRLVVDAQDRPVLFGQFGSSATTYRVERFDYASTKLGEISFTPAFVQRLNLVTWKFPVTNTGPDSTDVTVDVDAPTTLESTEFSSTNGGSVVRAADGTGGTWTVPQLASGATATLTMTGRPGNVGVLTVGSSITSQSSVRVGAAPSPMSSSVMVYGAATPRDDVITGTPQRDVIDALAGNDKVMALAGNDTIAGGDGNDELDLDGGNDRGDGGNGDDKLDLGVGNDVGTGGDGNDMIDAGPGNDTVTGGAGRDGIVAGPGNDRVSGNEGDDRIQGNDGDDRLYGNDGNDDIDGGKGNDVVLGGAGVDRLLGSTGDDYLIGLTGNDQLVGGPGRDKVDGDGGNDLLRGNSGSDWLNGKTGNDVAYGGTGNDWLRGFTGNDLLVGEAGNDLLNGGLGKDRLYGGVGNDIFRADDGKGGDYVNCGSGWDLVYANPGDIVTKDCEFVKYDVFAVAMP